MTKLIHKTGDIFTTDAKAIGHGVNVAGVMGHGIAVQFRNRYPDMYLAYREVCIAEALTPGDTMAWPVEGGFVYNIASQDAPGRNARMHWLVNGLIAVLTHMESEGLDVLALPRIGSGIGGLDQDEVEEALVKLAEGSKVDIELWTLPSKVSLEDAEKTP